LEEYAMAQEEEECFTHHQKLYPRATHNQTNHRGKPIFNMSAGGKEQERNYFEQISKKGNTKTRQQESHK
jgi:hypothetical protein